jgi:hypothetical protein
VSNLVYGWESRHWRNYCQQLAHSFRLILFDKFGLGVAASAGPSEVLVSQTVKDLVAGTGLLLEDRGERELRGVPGTWRVYRASPAEPAAER